MDELSGRHIVICGGSGFLGMNLHRALRDCGARVTIVSRNRPAGDGVEWRAWDGHSAGPWREALDGADGVVNLAGRTVDCVKTPDHCDEILRSRVESTRALGQALQRCTRRPPVWVQMSTAHIYGDSLDRVCDEDAATGFGLAPTVGAAWEAACRESCPEGVRTVLLRTSFVLGRRGGALQRMAGLARWGLGGRIGHGRQGISWIHERDMNRIFVAALTDAALEGVYLATAPHPVPNADFMRAIRAALRMPIGLPAPAWGVRLAAPLLLRTDPELALYGRYCIPQRLLDHGFTFEFPEAEPALRDLLAR